ncbi:hypothetical protein HK098_006181 [Nowakowskiella sp. JEL0407]|nr:hypothetical protein HK098_006181 [Nowakowskiella sp. JEL0407]
MLTKISRAARSLSRGPSGRISSSAFVDQPQRAMSTTSSTGIDFNPMPTTTGKCSDLKIKIHLEEIYCASGNLTGRIDVISNSDTTLYIGEIMVELAGYEELSDKSNYNQDPIHHFKHEKVVFQGKNKAPTAAVYGLPDERDLHGYWRARKAKTTFPFSFDLNANSASSFEFFEGVESCLKYVIRGMVKYSYNGRADCMFKSKEAYVVESVRLNTALMYAQAPTRRVGTLEYKPGQYVSMEVILNQKFYIAGSDLNVEVKVNNKTKKVISNIKLSLQRRLVIKEINSGSSVYNPRPHVTHEKLYKHSYDPDEERTNMLLLTIPSTMRTVMGDTLKLAEVHCFLVVTLSPGGLLKGLVNNELVLEVPINIIHNFSMNAPRTISESENIHPSHFNNTPADYSESPRGRSSVVQKASSVFSKTPGRGKSHETPRRTPYSGSRMGSESSTRTPRRSGSSGGYSDRNLPWELNGHDYVDEEYHSRSESRSIERTRKSSYDVISPRSYGSPKAPLQLSYSSMNLTIDDEPVETLTSRRIYHEKAASSDYELAANPLIFTLNNPSYETTKEQIIPKGNYFSDSPEDENEISDISLAPSTPLEPFSSPELEPSYKLSKTPISATKAQYRSDSPKMFPRPKYYKKSLSKKSLPNLPSNSTRVVAGSSSSSKSSSSKHAGPSGSISEPVVSNSESSSTSISRNLTSTANSPSTSQSTVSSERNTNSTLANVQDDIENLRITITDESTRDREVNEAQESSFGMVIYRRDSIYDGSEIDPSEMNVVAPEHITKYNRSDHW